jgi:hypothetical protein
LPARIRRRGVEKKLVIPGAEPSETSRSADPALLRLVARSRHWFEAIASGRVTSFKEIAKAEEVSEQFVSNRISLAFLAPQIVEGISAGCAFPNSVQPGIIELLRSGFDRPIGDDNPFGS